MIDLKANTKHGNQHSEVGKIKKIRQFTKMLRIDFMERLSQMNIKCFIFAYFYLLFS